MWGTDPEGTGFLKDWPGLDGEAAEYLIEKGVSLVGCEDNLAHYALLGNEVYVVENPKNLGVVPPWSLFVALLLKVKRGSGSPVRALAVVPKEE